jgi:indoleamine 2,3-dioxygenase
MAGSENSTLLPEGIFYKGVSSSHDLKHSGKTLEEGSFFKYAGASAGQSPIMHCLDVILGIHHGPTQSDYQLNEPAYIYKMRDYMLKEHRDFIQALEKQENLHDFLKQHPDHAELTQLYNDCVGIMVAMRDYHIQLVARYIVSASRKATDPESAKDALIAKGTGGTSKIV